MLTPRYCAAHQEDRMIKRSTKGSSPEQAATAPRESDEGLPAFFGLSPNQVVAYNLALARAQRRWTQAEATAALEPYLGVRWSVVNYSAAERSVAGERIRNFDADEIVAFARAFELPVTWFFMPPDPAAGEGAPIALAVPDGGRFGKAITEMVDLVFGDRSQVGLLSTRLGDFLDHLGALPLTAAQRQIQELADARVANLVRHSFANLSNWRTSLRSLANQIEDLLLQAQVLTYDDLEVPEEARS